MEIIFCLIGMAVFWLVIMPAANISGRNAEAERNAEALDRLTKP
jgi:hypothetical protein